MDHSFQVDPRGTVDLLSQHRHGVPRVLLRGPDELAAGAWAGASAAFPTPPRRWCPQLVPGRRNLLMRPIASLPEPDTTDPVVQARYAEASPRGHHAPRPAGTAPQYRSFPAPGRDDRTDEENRAP
ncbi:hypothetical protein [Catellatospora sichuanensis]|uniref:hypothetical protein n=1 Tax=Catellatospora sichuanensis TaxID=1969805 RepID=UPI0011841D72|nr:hypothetical protein [Catellatospora sichuanensis]